MSAAAERAGRAESTAGRGPAPPRLTWKEAYSSHLRFQQGHPNGRPGHCRRRAAWSSACSILLSRPCKAGMEGGPRRWPCWRRSVDSAPRYLSWHGGHRTRRVVAQRAGPDTGDAAPVVCGRAVVDADLMARYRVGSRTVRRWFAEAGLTPQSASLKNRPRGALRPVQRPTTDRLEQLYLHDGLSITRVAQRLNSTTHLVRTWLWGCR